MQRRRDLELAVAAFGPHRDELLHEEWIPFGGLDDLRPRLPGQLAEPLHERLAVRLRERLERDDGRVRPRRRPRRAPLEKIRPCGAEQEKGGIIRERGDVLDQVEESRLCPVQVVEDDDQRPGLGQGLEELPEAPRNLLRSRRRLGRAERDADAELGEAGVGAGAERLAQVSDLVDDLGERPVGDSLSVREAAADHDASVCASEQLAGEPRLADSRRADDRRELRCARLDRARERVLEPAELVGAADERGFDRTRESRHLIEQLENPEGWHRLALALQRQRLHRLGANGIAHERLRPSADQNLTRSGGLLEAGRDVDRVARHQRLAASGDDLARVDSDPHLQSERLEGVAHLDGCAHRANRIVLVDLRQAEDGHGGVADELLDGAAVVLEDRAELGVVAAHQVAQDLGVGALAQRSRADEVAEDDRHRLAHLGRPFSKRLAAGTAEAEARRILGSTGWTDHGRSVHQVARRFKRTAVSRRGRVRAGPRSG
jgi:hypothetical protein